MSPTSHVPGKKISELESIRGLAALFIVLFHVPRWNSLFDNGIFNNSYLMVELFFVLSGFVMLTSYGERLNTGKDLLKFQFLRLGRLYPLHILFLAAFVLIEILKYLASQNTGIVGPNPPAFSKNGPFALIEHLLLVQAIGPTGNNFTFNVPAWSISVEFYTYLVFGLAAMLFGKSKLLIYAVISLISLVLLATGNDHGFDLLLKCFTGFFLGCLVAALTKRIRFTVPGYFSATFVLMILAFIYLKKGIEHDWLIFLPTAALIFSVANMARQSGSGILANRFFVWLGTISYSLYMCHMFVIWVLNQLVRFILKRPEALDLHGNYTPQLSTAEAIIGLIVIFASVIATSTAVHHLIENPMREGSRRLADRLFRSRRQPIAGLEPSES